MLRAFVSSRHRFQLRRLRTCEPNSLRSRLRLVSYESARYRLGLGGGAYVFTNLEALDTRMTERACQIASAIRDTDPDAIILNDPRYVMRRYELLRDLYRAGVNSFSCCRVDEGVMPEQYPVFLRGESDHRGAAPKLLRNESELRVALAQPESLNVDRSRRLIVGFVDTREAGDPVYRKYAAMRVGDEIIAGHINFNEHWMVKLKRDLTPAEAAIQQEYIDTNPHRDEIMAVFERARIQYGRVDYGVGENGIEVWEINSNPTYSSQSNEAKRVHWAQFAPVMQKVAQALARIADQGAGRPGVPSRALRPIRPRWWRNLAR